MKKLVILISMFLLVPPTLFGYYPKEKITINKIKYKSENEQLVEQNNIVLNKVQKLQKYANEYIQEKQVTTTATELSLSFIRKDKYSTGFWTTLLGNIDTEFVTFVSTKDPSLVFTDEDYLIDKATMKNIDFIHMCAALNTYYRFKNTTSMFSPHYAGWAGDLMTLLSEVVTYRTTNSITDTTVLENYTSSILGTNKGSTFSQQDAFADLDALNISAITTLDTDLYTTLYNYYMGENKNSRSQQTQAILGTNEAIQTTAYQLISNTMAQRMLIANYASVTTSDLNILSQAFADYVYQHGYIELSTNSGETTVGTPLEIQLIEKHMTNATIESNTDVAVGKVINSKLIITPVNHGTTDITVTSPINNVSATYKVTVTNIAPAIEEDLLLNENLKSNQENIISFTATGTNNTYTWYLSNNPNGKDKILTTTTEPVLKLIPTMDYNNKYLTCEIKNDGNNPILTSSIQLKVDPTNPVTAHPITTIIGTILFIITILSTTIFMKKRFQITRKSI